MPGKLCSSIKLRQALGKHGSARSVCAGRGEGECRGGRAVPVPQTGPFAIGATTEEQDGRAGADSTVHGIPSCTVAAPSLLASRGGARIFAGYSSGEDKIRSGDGKILWLCVL